MNQIISSIKLILVFLNIKKPCFTGLLRVITQKDFKYDGCEKLKNYRLKEAKKKLIAN